MSLLKYNSIALPYPFITHFEQRAALDPVGQTDHILTEFNIQVQSVINAAYLDAISADVAALGPRNAADTMNVIREKLLEPRKQLSVTFDGIELIPSRNLAIDAKNGPFPQRCTITQLTNETFLVTYHVIANYFEHNKDRPGNFNGVVVNQEGNKVLFNRWTEQVTMDDCMFSTRTRSGTFMIRSDHTNDNRIVDQVRSQMAVTGVPAGFLRQSSNYTVSPDGLSLQYTIVDKEQFKMPPKPAFRASGKFTQATRYGAHRSASVTVRLRGAKTTNQSDLVTAAVMVCAEKLDLVGIIKPATAKKSIIAFASVEVDLYENEVTCSMQSILKPMSSKDGKGRIAGVCGLSYQDVATTPLSDGITYTPAYTDRGSAGLLLQAAAYYDPSLKTTVLNKQTGQLSAGLEPGKGGAVQP